MRTVSFLPDLLSQGPWQPLTNADDYAGREVMASNGRDDILLLQYDESVMDIVSAWAWQTDGIHPVSLSYVARLLGDQIYPANERWSDAADAAEDAAWDENERRSRSTSDCPSDGDAMQSTETYYQVEITNARLSLHVRRPAHATAESALDELRSFTARQPDTVARVVRVQVTTTEVDNTR